MNEFITALTPAFAIALGMEVITQILYPAVYLAFNKGKLNIRDGEEDENIIYYSTVIVGIIVFFVSFCIVYKLPDDICVLSKLSFETYSTFLGVNLDIWITALIISSGTEGFKSIVSFVKNADMKKIETTRLIRKLRKQNISIEKLSVKEKTIEIKL